MTSTFVATPCRCRRPPGRIPTDLLARPVYASRPTPGPPSGRWLAGMGRPQSITGVGGTRGRWATVRAPVLDATGAALLWTAMAVDLATRPLASGQSASTPAAYLWAALIAGPFAVHRRFPVIAIVVSDLALIGYGLGRYSAFPGYATFALVFAVALHAGRHQR